MTEENEIEDTDQAETDARTAVPLGAMIAYFGAGQKPPKGYIWADGRSRWPTNARWVPKALRGQPVPNMTGQFLAGATVESEVGNPSPKPKDVEGAIKGKAAVPATGVSADGNMWAFSKPGVINFRENNVEIPCILRGGDNRASLTNFPKINGSSATSAPVTGTASIPAPLPPPPHVFCHWIIRVK